MLIFGEKLLNAPILSLQTGVELARTDLAIINPTNLKIVAFRLTGPLLSDQTQNSYMRTNEIREYSPLGLIVDSADEIMLEEDIISQKDLFELGFDPVGLGVVDEFGKKLGKVNGYTVNVLNFTIMQLRVLKTGMARLTTTDLLIHRSQILEINNTTIVVKATATKLKDVTPIINTEPIINPFRRPTLAHELQSSSDPANNS